ncbi:high frequency lysogenization protein HflD [Rheinheimera sp.]|uniref:high frequency lysogenization protein HflD n=1 Tax=Rheinheimera sp. TaxID=1869214 RepID=UPI00307F73DE
MQQTIQNQTLALAGICQALRLLQKVTRTAELSSSDLHHCLNTVANLNPQDALDVYGGSTAHLKEGYQALVSQLGDNSKKDVELTRYVVSVIALERKLNKTPANLEQLGKKLSRLEQQLQHFSITDESVIGSLADTYVECISSLGTRIQVAGQPELLKQNLVQHKVRALLLAAIRSAVLWRQAGGSRLHFIFKRKAILAEAKAVLQQLSTMH